MCVKNVIWMSSNIRDEKMLDMKLARSRNIRLWTCTIIFSSYFSIFSVLLRFWRPSGVATTTPHPGTLPAWPWAGEWLDSKYQQFLLQRCTTVHVGNYGHIRIRLKTNIDQIKYILVLLLTLCMYVHMSLIHITQAGSRGPHIFLSTLHGTLNISQCSSFPSREGRK